MAGSGTDHLRSAADTLLRAENLVVEFPIGNAGLKVHAVSDVSIDVRDGETLGLVGESGCGKSTTGKAMMQLPRPTSGAVLYHGQDLTQLAGSDLRKVRPDMQMIFQDPISSLNPRRRVKDIVAEPLRIWLNDRTPPSGAIKGAAGLMWLAVAARALFALGIFLSLFVEISAFKYTAGWVLAVALIDTFLMGLLLAALAGGVGQRSLAATWATGLVAAVLALVFLIELSSGSLSTAQLAFTAVLDLTPAAAFLLCITRLSELKSFSEQVYSTVHKTLEDVGIDADAAWRRRPHQFSGGQCQRICIARALVLDPKLIICDEPVSALDVSVQAQILNLLETMKARYNLTLVFIAHDLAVVKNVSDRVAVMYLGKLCEIGPPDDLYARPAHPYTAALLTSIPVPDPTIRPREEATLGGELPSPVAPPSGCRFRTRCPRVQDKCAQLEPRIRQIGLGHYVACHFPLEDTSVRPGARPVRV